MSAIRRARAPRPERQCCRIAPRTRSADACLTMVRAYELAFKMTQGTGIGSLPSQDDAGGMFTLHIEHPISDFGTWRNAFDGFADMRGRSGVLSHTIRQPADDPAYVLIDLDFDTAG